jgi:quinohemoprotein ethanol dehydrogenase
VKHWIWIGAVGCALLTGVGRGSCTADEVPRDRGIEVGWPYHNGSSDETSYTALAQIDRHDVGRLGLAWYLDLPDEQMLEATPLAVDGVLYFTGSRATVYAADAVHGNLLWSYDPEVWRFAEKMRYIMPANRGVAYAAGRVFVGATDGRLIALDARTGKLVWSVDTLSAGSVQTITGAPRVFDGKVIIGQGGSDFGARGYVTAYDQATGRRIWRFYTAPGNPQENRGDPVMERAAATWNGEFWKKGTGAGPWDNITFDRALDRIYIGTGNAAPYDPEERSPGGGDNLFTASIVALDAGTGNYLWHYQVNPRDSWDYDDTQQMALADLCIDGKSRQVLLQAPKNGFLYVIDRLTGKLISAGKIGKVTWADHIDLGSGRPVEADGIRYQHGEVTLWPQPAGTHNWHTMSFDPKTGLVYIPYLQLGMSFAKRANDKGMLGGVEMHLVKQDPQDGKGALLAYDPIKQKPIWKIQHAFYWNGGVMSTAGGLVFQGTADGWFSAYDASTGERLWRFNAGLGIIAAPISYAAHGHQYIAVLVGYGGSNSLGDMMNAGWKYGAQTRRLLAFRLDGEARLPASPPQDFSVHPVDDPAVTIDPDDAAAGAALFTAHCSACHGLNAISAGAPAPDLRESRLATSCDSLWTVVHDGVFLKKGMARLDQLDAAQVGSICAYIRVQARAARAAAQ